MPSGATAQPYRQPRVSKVVRTRDPSGRERHETHYAREGSGGRARGTGGAGRESRNVSKSVSPAAPQLFAQFLICGVFITASVMTEHKTYLDRMSEVLWRLTAVTALYFILALASMNKSANKVAVEFGWLIVGVIFLKSVSNIGRVFNVVSGSGTGQPDTELTADNTTDAPPHEFLQ